MDPDNTNVVPQPAAAPVNPTPAPAVTERTADQFAKLLESNHRLAEENAVYRKSIEILNTTQQPTVAPKVQNQTPATQPQTNGFSVQDFIQVDPTTGERFIDEQKLAARIAEVEQKSSRVDTVENEFKNYVKTQQEQQVQRETQEAQRAFPELDPKAQNFDADFLRDVRARVTDSMINPTDYNLGAGQRLEFKQAAELVKAQYAKFGQTVTQKVTEQQEQEAQQAAADAKAQATAQVPSSSAPANAYSTVADADLTDLRRKTRFGDDFALAKRLLHTEHIVPRDGSGGSSA